MKKEATTDAISKLIKNLKEFVDIQKKQQNTIEALRFNVYALIVGLIFSYIAIIWILLTR